MMPSFIRGVINLRGRVVPVVDISARFGRVPTQVGRRTSILIVDTSARSGDDGDGGLPSCMGILVDGVNKVMHLNPEDVEPPPAFGAGSTTPTADRQATEPSQPWPACRKARPRLCLSPQRSRAATSKAG